MTQILDLIAQEEHSEFHSSSLMGISGTNLVRAIVVGGALYLLLTDSTDSPEEILREYMNGDENARKACIDTITVHNTNRIFSVLIDRQSLEDLRLPDSQSQTTKGHLSIDNIKKRAESWVRDCLPQRKIAPPCEIRQLFLAHGELIYTLVALTHNGFGIRNVWKADETEPEVLLPIQIAHRFLHKLYSMQVHFGGKINAMAKLPEVRAHWQEMQEDAHALTNALLSELFHGIPVGVSLQDCKSKDSYVKISHHDTQPVLRRSTMNQMIMADYAVTVQYWEAWNKLREGLPKDKLEELKNLELRQFEVEGVSLSLASGREIYKTLAAILGASPAERDSLIDGARARLGKNFKLVEEALAAAGK